jgi:hypothetical protein
MSAPRVRIIRTFWVHGGNGDNPTRDELIRVILHKFGENFSNTNMTVEELQIFLDDPTANDDVVETGRVSDKVVETSQVPNSGQGEGQPAFLLQYPGVRRLKVTSLPLLLLCSRFLLVLTKNQPIHKQIPKVCYMFILLALS